MKIGNPVGILADISAARHPERDNEPDRDRYARHTRNAVIVIAVLAVIVFLFAPIW